MSHAPADERTATTQHDALLAVHMFLLLSLNNMLLLKALESKRLALVVYVLY